LATIVSQKVTRVTPHPLYYSMCPSPVRMQAADVGTTHKRQVQQPAFHKVA